MVSDSDHNDRLVPRSRRHAIAWAVAGVSLALIPAATAGGLRAAGSPPVAGLWKLHSANIGQPEVSGGSFTLSSHQVLTGFTLIVGPGAESPCGTGHITVKVLGSEQLVRDPLDDLGNPTAEYTISSPTNATEAVSVKVAVNGREQAGQLEIAFGTGSRGGPHTGGTLVFNGGSCEIFFGERKT